MVFKNLRVNIISRVILLAIAIFLFFFFLQKEAYYVTPVVLVVIILFIVLSIISYVEKISKDLTSFLQSIRYSDFNRSYRTSGHGKIIDELQNAFDLVIKDFQKIRAEKEEHYFYLQNVIQHIGIGILSYQKDGKVELINNAAKRLFQMPGLEKIQDLKKWSSEMEDALLNIKAGDNKLVKVIENDNILQLTVHATEFKLQDRFITLVSIKDIQMELEEKEMESWQKLIRVLTHEIMNSIAPISSLTSTLNLMIKQVAESMKSGDIKEDDIEAVMDIESAINTIHKRSVGLINFVENYRSLTKIPKPNFKIFEIKSLFENIKVLLKEELDKEHITLKSTISPESLQIIGDEQLIEQVLLNLVRNSIHALENKQNKEIKFNAFNNNRDKITIQVIDNGQGIIKEVLDKIFIPFFTTKPKGSGIGLSLSKQIMRLHGGSISIQSEPDVETCCTLTF